MQTQPGWDEVALEPERPKGFLGPRRLKETGSPAKDSQAEA